ncbi:MAG TPA: DUF4337 domain-containing protein [Burkholderiaceae bacterium]|nr:DUF4337 domain-containing protein [Burkholderiaceae bacterium]HQR70693.1 DUF4337 domain-containing protein [Burkholderiaceae bacterium]
MSGTHFHVHGPHDHELEHAAHGEHAPAAHGKADSFSGRIAVTTAILATVGALFAYQGGATQANASIYKNNAAIKKTEASNQWNYYQAKSSKQNLAELGANLAGAEKAEQFRAEAERYKGEKAEIQAAAQKLEAEAKEWDQRSEGEMHQHHRWAQATTALQIAIAMAAIALLTRRSWLQYAMYGVAGLGAVLGLLAALHI